MRVSVMLAGFFASRCRFDRSGPPTRQTYPDRPVRIVGADRPGGSYDFVARLLAEQLSKRLATACSSRTHGRRPIVGTRAAATAAPDGYTLLIGASAHGLQRRPLQEAALRTTGGFVSGRHGERDSYILVGHKDLPYSTPKEIIEAARKNPAASVRTPGSARGSIWSAPPS